MTSSRDLVTNTLAGPVYDGGVGEDVGIIILLLLLSLSVTLTSAVAQCVSVVLV